MGMPMDTRALAFAYRYRMVSIIFFCFSSGTQVS